MIDFFLQVLVWWLLIEAAIFVVHWFLNYRNTNREEQEIARTMDIIRQHCTVVRVETVDDIHLMYDHLTGNFVCQGNDESDLWNRAKELFPGKKFIVRNEHEGQPTFAYKR